MAMREDGDRARVVLAVRWHELGDHVADAGRLVFLDVASLRQLVLGVGARDDHVDDIALRLLLGKDLLATLPAALVDALEVDARKALDERISDRVEQGRGADSVDDQFALFFGRVVVLGDSGVERRIAAAGGRGGRRLGAAGAAAAAAGAVVGAAAAAAAGAVVGLGAAGAVVGAAAAGGALVGVAARGGLQAASASAATPAKT